MRRLLLIAIAWLSMLAVVMATTVGPNAGGTFANGTGVLLTSWSNVANAGAEDGSSATVTPVEDTTSKALKATNFGFSVPAGATINGITVEVRRSRTDNGGALKDAAVFLVKGGSGTGNDKKSASTWPTSLTYTTYGGAADLWGATLTSTDVNASTFGFQISVADSGFGLDTANVDFIRITIDYTAAAGPTQAQKQSGFFMH